MMEGTSANSVRADHAATIQGLRRLCKDFFRDFSWIDRCEAIEAAQMSAAARKLLDHRAHMTPSLRAHHEQELRLEVRAEHLDGEHYSRKIKLLLPDGRVAEFGIMRIDLRTVPPEAQAAIRERQTPLGDILAAHKVLTRVEPWAFVRFAPPSPILACLGRDDLPAAHGRLATIHCNGERAVELLEVVPE